MIYTSYFGKMKKIEKEQKKGEYLYFPMSIAASTPKWFVDKPRIKCLMPDFDLVNGYKSKNVTDEDYTERYRRNVLSKLNMEDVIWEIESNLPKQVVSDFRNLETNIARSFSVRVVLLCYEKPGEFCHRHIAADWFKENGIEVEELDI